MPTYEYKCEACGHLFEKFQSITAPAIRKCPKCGKRKVRRLIGTGAGLIFKGSGFYITDYRSEGYKSAEKADTNASSGTAGSGESGGDKGKSSESKKQADHSAPATKSSDAKSNAAGSAGGSTGKSESKSAEKKGKQS